ncbi:MULTISPECIES: LacI family DNA-binding transcriptional regulator [unclassified Oceanispirochaeta]|uniref:LacI family DNA-binding transcriptional regulator n=1 Tax=unclassified Oceanispirochaeta TaxID=2635722 RepID=UPI000E090513|nr:MULTISPECIES: LacI family DNA-binding transcriptional regulator [unclassified Oceanispirochaeta]MBF9014994.1 LacI family DNA-binding transcriptional regulator [Oceanispirochaeta sp. M2]NPD71325.1 LacI family transcriptional regulator [Oceanispirochaeta sp. M1]RDG33291.1 LacI family transcriptional regulator [Oceanispirochaeta sp. M1]
MSITLRDLSRHTGVSLGTVSRYINGETVREKTREKLEAAIKELGYKENIVTKAKRTGSSMTIAVVLSALNAEFVMKIVEALDNELSPHMFSLLLVNFHEDPAYLKKRFEELRFRKIDGLIFFPSGLEGDIANEIKTFLDAKIPVVAIDDFVHGLETDAVVVDNRNSTFRATEYLIQQGHRKIGFLAGRKNSFVAQNRYKGCREAFEAYDIPWDESLVRWADFEMNKARKMFNELMKSPDPPTAVFPTNYDMTIGTLLSIVNKKISIPEDLSLFGYDQFSGTEAVSPKLSLVVQPVDKIGKTAAEILLKRIRGNWDDFPKTVELNTKMIIRDSIKKI